MISVKDILNFDLDKIGSAPLRKTIEEWISDYQKEKDKKLFEQESKQTMEKLYDMVSRFAPEAIKKSKASSKSEKPKSDKPKSESKKSESTSQDKSKKPSSSGKQEKLMKVLFLVIGDFKGVLEELKESDLEEADMVVLLDMTNELEKALESGDKDKIEQVVDEQIDKFIKWQQKMMQSDLEDHHKSAKKATESMNKMLKELGIDPLETDETSKSKPHSKKKPSTYTMSDGMKWKLLSLEEAQKRFKEGKEVYGLNRDEETEALIEEKDDFNRFEEFGIPYETPSQAVILTKDLVRNVADELTDIEIDLDGEDETIIATTRLDLEESLEEEKHHQFRKKVESAVKDFKDWAGQISKDKQKEQAITSMNKLLNALGQSELTMDGNAIEESKEERSKRILEELAALEPELAQCRAVVKEANRKKREAEGPKPKKRRATKLREKLLQLAALIPPNLKDNLDVQEKTEKILLKTHSQLIEAWGMSKVQAEHGAKAIEKRFDDIEEKLSKEVESRSITDRKDGGYQVAEYFKDGHKETTRLLKATIDWVNEHKGGSFDNVGAKELLKKNAEFQKKRAKKSKDKEVITLEIKYVDGSNYKTDFEHEVNLKKFPEAKSLKKGDQITMGEYGTLNEDLFFDSEIHPHKYDENYDHNLLDIIGISKTSKKDKNTKEPIEWVKVDKHGSAYALIDDKLNVKPILKSGRIASEEPTLVEESPKSDRKIHEQALIDLGVKDKLKRDGILCSIAYY